MKFSLFLFVTTVIFRPLLADANTQEPNSAYENIKGLPKVIHYTQEDYNSDSQFWAMCEDDEGILYFGNNDGILIFDGERWQFIKLPNGSTVRSLKHSSDGKVYAGGYSEIGQVKKDESGKYYYESMLQLVPGKDRNFADVWQINEIYGYIVFRSFKSLIAIKNNNAIILTADQQFTYSSVIHDEYYYVDNSQLKSVDFRSLDVETIISEQFMAGKEVAGISTGKEQDLLLFTRSGDSYFIDPENKSWKFNRHHLPKNSSDQIYCVYRSDKGLYYLGTINNQLITYELLRDQEDVQININNLQDNTVLNLYETDEGNIWAMLNKGIDCIEVSSPVSILFDNAAVYDATIKDNLFYLATNQGVYISPLTNKPRYLSRSDFRLMEGLAAQAWTFNYHKGKILVGHDKGIFVIEGMNSYHVEGTNGIWKVLPVSGRPDKLLVCTYSGFLLLEYKNDRFILNHTIDGFDISTRDVMPTSEPGVYWVCHGYNGVYKIKINEELTKVISVEHYSEKHGLPSTFGVNVFKWNDDVVFTTSKGIYTFDNESDHFKLYHPLIDMLGENYSYRKIFQDEYRTWSIQDGILGYVDMSSEGKEFEKDLFLSLKGNLIKTMELIKPLGEKRVLIGTNNALYQFDLSDEFQDKKVKKTMLTSISYKNPKDSLKHLYLPLNSSEIAKLPYNTPDLRFEYTTPEFYAQSDIQYSYKLEPIDESWSSWQNTSFKEYSFLQSGNYTFRVKSRSLLGEKSDEASFDFEILPVWYKTQMALFLFTILGMIVLITTIILVKRKIRKTREEERKLRKVLELELQQIKLEREKAMIIKDKKELEKDVLFKSKELANYTMLLVKKRELLTEMHEELKSLRGLVKNEKSRQKIRELNKKINFNLQDEEHLKIFEVNFERVHQDFFHNLKTNYPQLSQKDLQLCAFVKMNLSNKEISSILNISVRGVETARYRLRKRLDLHHEDNMAEFFESLENDVPQEEESHSKG